MLARIDGLSTSLAGHIAKNGVRRFWLSWGDILAFVADPATMENGLECLEELLTSDGGSELKVEMDHRDDPFSDVDTSESDEDGGIRLLPLESGPIESGPELETRTSIMFALKKARKARDDWTVQCFELEEKLANIMGPMSDSPGDNENAPLLTASSETQGGMSEDHRDLAAKLFERYDLDGSGDINSPSELEQLVTSMLYSTNAAPPVTKYMNERLLEFTDEQTEWGESWNLPRFIDWFHMVVCEANAQNQ